MFTRAIAGGIAAWAGEHAPFNKVAGLGFGGPVDEAELETVELEFGKQGAPTLVELSSMADPEVGAMLTERGYVLHGFENVLGCALPSAAVSATTDEIRVSPSPAAELDTWLDVLIGGFTAPDTQGVEAHEEFPREILESAMHDMAAADGFQLSLARIEDTPTGGASLHLGERIAHLCGAATLPAWRRRGVQTALLAARLRIAADAGCEVAVMMVQPGSKSQQNAQGLGFSLLYSRAVLLKLP